jgi:hypothetical protein
MIRATDVRAGAGRERIGSENTLAAFRRCGPVERVGGYLTPEVSSMLTGRVRVSSTHHGIGLPRLS